MKKNNKKTIKAISIALALGVGAGLFATGAVITKREFGYKTIAREFVEQAYIAEENTLYLSEDNNTCLLPNYKECTTITRGRYLQNEIEKKGILYCEILDEYYTKNASPIAIIDTSLSEGKAVYRRMVLLSDLQEPLEIQDNETITIVNSKSYDDLKSLDLVVEMPEEDMVIYHGEEKYRGDLRLR